MTFPDPGARPAGHTRWMRLGLVLVPTLLVSAVLLATIGLLLNPANPMTPSIARDVQAAVQSVGLKAVIVEASSERDIDTAFAQFVKDNPEHIQAISILQKQPDKWNTAALSELREKLASAPLHFTLPNLQKAHEVHYQRALVDIISMVKHATDDQTPLLTAEERVEHAFKTVTTGKTFTKEQQQWLDRIKAHLAENLSIDEEDFELPIFSRLGGWKKANGIFFGELTPLIHSFNQAIAI